MRDWCSARCITGCIGGGANRDGRNPRRSVRALFWAFIYNSVGVPVAAMALSSLSVIVNSALLKRQKLAEV
jgi:hypothetical protein